MSIKVSNRIIQDFASEGRTIVSRWRCRYFLWLAGEPFADEARALRIIRTMERMGWVEELDGGKGQLFRITAPFAPETPNPYEAALEGYHGCTLGYGTALELHQLTDQRETTIHLLNPSGIQGYSLGDLKKQRRDTEEAVFLQQLPVGTDPDAWQVNDVPRYAKLTEVADRDIVAHSVQDKHLFDCVEMDVHGVSLRVSSLEKTLVDTLRHPSHSGGLNDVFRAWARAMDQMNIELVMNATERFQSKILYQRAGYVLETLGFKNPRLEQWKTEHVIRGGSRLLDASAPYAPEFSESWGISINHPIDVLEEA